MRADTGVRAAGRSSSPRRRPRRVGSLLDEPAEVLKLKGRTSGTHDRTFVTSLARGLSLLRALEDTGEPLGNHELAAATGLPKATISRLAYTLTCLGYLSHDPALGKYQLGPAALALGHMALMAMRIRNVAKPFLQRFADQAGLSVGLGTRNGLDMVLIENCHCSDLVTLRLETGSRIPLAQTSMGRAFLAALPADERRYLMSRLALRHRAKWPALEKEIACALEEVRTGGFCSSIGAWMRDVSGVAVPLPLRDGLYAVNCGGQNYRTDRYWLVREVGPGLVGLVREIRKAAEA